MSKEDFTRIEGRVEEVLPGTLFRVTVSGGQEVLAHLAGKMRMYRIRILPGDRVIMEMSSYDQTKGRIVRRL